MIKELNNSYEVNEEFIPVDLPLKDEQSGMNIHITSLVGRVGSEVISVESLEDRFNKPRGTITPKTGVTVLRRLAKTETIEDLATDVSTKAISNSEVDIRDIHGIFASTNPTTEYLLPTFAPMIAQRLGLRKIQAHTIGAGCAGGIMALQAAYNQLIVDVFKGKESNYLVVTGDHTSRFLDPDEYSTAILFSEGVSAMVVTNIQSSKRCMYKVTRIESKTLAGDGLYALSFKNPLLEKNSYLRMDGRKIFNFGVDIFPEILKLVSLNALPQDTYFIPHQANLRMIRRIVEEYKLNSAQVYTLGIETIGNTSGPACFLGLEDALQKGLLTKDRKVLLGTFGADLQVAAAFLEPEFN